MNCHHVSRWLEKLDERNFSWDFYLLFCKKKSKMECKHSFYSIEIEQVWKSIRMYTLELKDDANELHHEVIVRGHLVGCYHYIYSSTHKAVDTSIFVKSQRIRLNPWGFFTWTFLHFQKCPLRLCILVSVNASNLWLFEWLHF